MGSKHKIILVPPDLNIYDQSRHLVRTNILFTPSVFLRENMHENQLINTVLKGLFHIGDEWEEMHPFPAWHGEIVLKSRAVT